MKKFVKLGAVLTALILVASCFMACKNDSSEEEEGTSGGGSEQTGGSGSTASALAGLWLDDGEGYYIVGNKMYEAEKVGEDYYYFDKFVDEDKAEEKVMELIGEEMDFDKLADLKKEDFEWKDASMTIEVAGDKVTTTVDGEKTTATYAIADGKLTLTFERGSETLTKVDATPKKFSDMSVEEMLEFFMPDMGEEEE